MPPLDAGLTQDQMRDKIRHERRIEFVFEGQRWMDLKRWGQLSKIGGIGTSQAPTAYVFQPKNTVWPFPQSEVDYYKAHNADLGQNTGY